MKHRELGIWWDGVLVATLSGRRPGQVECQYQPEILAQHQGNIPFP